MARGIPFRTPGVCIDCSGLIKGYRHHATYRCAECHHGILAARDAAMKAVIRAVRLGDLPRVGDRPCVDCESPATDYDHRDYRKPLDVVPVCRTCNLRRGPAMWAGYRDGSPDLHEVPDVLAVAFAEYMRDLRPPQASQSAITPICSPSQP